MTQNRFEKHAGTLLTGFVIISLFSILFVAEIILSSGSLIQKQPTETRHIRLKEHRPNTVTLAVPPDTTINKADGLAKKEYRFEIDKNGYIYPSGIHETPEKTILFLGGSTTEALYVDEENRFPYLVSKIFKQQNKKVNTYNSGVSGNNSIHSINILLNKGLALNPDMVVMMHNINDMMILLYESSYWNNSPTRSLLIKSRDAENNSYSYHLKGLVSATFPELYKRATILKGRLRHANNDQNDEFAHIRGTKLVVNKQAIIKQFEKSLSTFISLCRSHEVIPVLMTQANRLKETPDKSIIDNWTLEKDFGITYETYKDIYDSMNDLIRKTGKSNKVTVIDLANKVPQESSHMYDMVHFNDHGSTFVAPIITRQLNRILYD